MSTFKKTEAPFNNHIISRQKHWQIAMLILLMLGYATFFSIENIQHHNTFGTRAMDVASMDQAVWNTLHGRFFAQTNNPAVANRLGLHVEPILFPISLFYLIHSGPETLFILESIIVALGAIPVFALARQKLHSKNWALLFALMYLTFPAIQGANMVEFHPITLAPAFILAAFYFLEARRIGYYALFAILTASTKEDMSLAVLMMGLYALIVNRQYRLGLITIGLSLLWAYAAVFVIPPHFANTENIHWSRYAYLGDSAGDIVQNFFRHPAVFYEQLQQINAPKYLLLLLAPTAFTALAAPLPLLMILPSLGINWLSSFTPMQQVTRSIYAAPLVPAVIISSIYGINNLQNRFRTQKYAKQLLGGIIFIAMAFTFVQYGFLPGGNQYRAIESVSPHQRAVLSQLANVPQNASVSALDPLVPHLSQRKEIYIYDRNDDADYLAFDLNEASWPVHPVELRNRIKGYLTADYGIVTAEDGFLLLAKNQPDLPKTIPDSFYDFTRFDASQNFKAPYPATLTFGNKIELLGYDVRPDSHQRGMTEAILYWRVPQTLSDNLALMPIVLNQSGDLLYDPEQIPLTAGLWYPTSQWSPDEIIRTKTLPFKIDGKVTLAVGVGNPDWFDTHRLPVTHAADGASLNKPWTVLAIIEQDNIRQVSVQPIHNFTKAMPLDAQNQSVNFGNEIALKSTQISQNADSLIVNLQWQALQNVDKDYFIFLHLVDKTGKTVAQFDGHPRWGYEIPTGTWHANEIIPTVIRMPLPSDLHTGEYTLQGGFYYFETLERLPILENGTPTADSIDLGSVKLE